MSRSADHTSAIVGQRQAGTFQALAGLSGHGTVLAQKSATPARRAANKVARKAAKKPKSEAAADPGHAETPPQRRNARDMGLTVRIEINLPAAPDQETCDRIFKSIRENLMNDE